MNKLLAERLKAVERSARVRRYHTEPVIHQQNVGEHTYGVMWFILLMVDNPSAALLTAALMHDTPEYAVGDVPSPTKKAPVIKQALDQLEDEVLERLLWKLPVISDAEARYLKLADLLEGAAFCLSEWRRGNRDISPALGNYLRYIATMHPDGKAGDIFNFIKEQAHEYGFQGE